MGYRAKVYYHHTDCGQVVYYGAYLAFLEEARTDFLARRGIDVGAFVKEKRYFVVAHQEIDYVLPARYGDTLDIETRVDEVGGVRIALRHRIVNARGQEVVRARTVLAFIDATFKPRPLPAAVREKITGGETTGEKEHA